MMGRKNQRGFIVASALVVTLSIAALIYFSFAMGLAAKEAGRLEDRKKEWVSDTQAKLTSWYERNKAAIDADPNQLTSTAVLSGAGVTLEYGAQVASTARLIAGGIGFHSVAIWIPHDGASGTGLNASTGEFNPGTLTGGLTAPTKYAFANGRAIQTDAYLATVARMRETAAKFEGYFQARVLSDPDSGSEVNYYRAANCASPINGELPCIDSYTSLAAAGLGSVVGLSTDENVSSWGGAIEVSNLADVPVGESAIAIRTAIPWGSPIQIFAVRP